MKATGNKKRSVIIMNKRTSVCLEDSFWRSLHAIVQMERTTIEAFIEGVKQEHDPRNLSSSLRVAILEYFQRIAVKDSGTPPTCCKEAAVNCAKRSSHSGTACIAIRWFSPNKPSCACAARPSRDIRSSSLCPPG